MGVSGREDRRSLTEHTSIKWLSPDGLKSLDWAPADIPAIEKLSRTSMINECFRKRI